MKSMERLKRSSSKQIFGLRGQAREHAVCCDSIVWFQCSHRSNRMRYRPNLGSASCRWAIGRERWSAQTQMGFCDFITGCSGYFTSRLACVTSTHLLVSLVQVAMRSSFCLDSGRHFASVIHELGSMSIFGSADDRPSPSSRPYPCSLGALYPWHRADVSALSRRLLPPLPWMSPSQIEVTAFADVGPFFLMNAFPATWKRASTVVRYDRAARTRT